MAPPVYRLISTDLRTGLRIAELTLSGLSYSRRLNDVGTVDGTLTLPELVTSADVAHALALNDAVDENRRLLLVERDGVIVADGIVYASPYTDATSSRSVSCVSLWSYLRRRYIRTRKSYAGVDQFDIVRDLVAYMQSRFGAAGSLGIVVETNDSGTLRDRTYEAWEVKEIGEAIEQLASVDGGFDFAIDCAWDPATGALIKTLRLANRRGRPFSESGHVFQVGRNVTDYRWPTDGSSMANRSIAVGAGEGASMLIEEAADSYQYLALGSGGPGYPVYEEVTSWKDTSVRSTLADRARAGTAARSRTIVLPELDIRADMDPVLGSYIEGDAARFIVSPNTSPRHPDGLDTYIRIMGWDVAVDDAGGETVTIVAGREI